MRQRSIFEDFVYGDMAFTFPNVDVHSEFVNLRMNKFSDMYRIFHSQMNRQTPNLDFTK